MKQYRCWLNIALECIGWILVVVLVFLALALFSVGFDLSAAALNLPYFPLLGGLLFSVIMPVSAHNVYLPVYLSLGSTRKAVSFGLHLMSAVIAVGAILLAALTCLLPGEISRRLFPLLPALFFTLLAVGCFGQLIGCVSAKHPKLGAILTGFTVFFVAGGSGGVGGWLSSGETLPALPTDTPYLALTLLAAAVAVILYSIEIPTQKRMLRSYEVKL